MTAAIARWIERNAEISRSGFLARLGTVTVGAMAASLIRARDVQAYCGTSSTYGCSGCGMCCNCASYNIANGACCWQLLIGCRYYECCDYNEGDPCGNCQCRFYIGYYC